MRKLKQRESKVLNGLAISPGIVVGRACLFKAGQFHYTAGVPLNPDLVPDEIARFEKAVAEAKADVEQITRKAELEIGLGEAQIFKVQSALLSDKTILDEIIGSIENDKLHAESALLQVFERYENKLSKIDNAYIKERGSDISEIKRRLMAKLSGDHFGFACANDPQCGGRDMRVVVAEELTPNVTIHLGEQKIVGFATERGGTTSHAAILAHAMGVPAVTNIADIGTRVKCHDLVIVDGNSGQVYINPPEETVRTYENLVKGQELRSRELAAMADRDAVTADGVKVELYANTSHLSDVDLAVRKRADGIGLYRTEFPFMTMTEFPTQDAQYEIYRTAFQKMKGKPVTFRVLDVGGDKKIEYLDMPEEENPHLGWRGIKVLLDNTDIFKEQLKAILRAGCDSGDRVGILYPMISSLTQFRRAKALLAEVRRELARDGVECACEVNEGVMFEVPSAFVQAQDLLREADFGSIGSNDLVQYLLAVDRDNGQVADDYNPLHPAVIRIFANMVNIAGMMHKPLSLCGEIAGNARFTKLLLGLGFRSLSMSPVYMLEVKYVIRNTSIAECEALARKALGCRTCGEVEALISEDEKVAVR